jgi:hypothetical protein
MRGHLASIFGFEHGNQDITIAALVARLGTAAGKSRGYRGHAWQRS